MKTNSRAFLLSVFIILWFGLFDHNQSMGAELSESVHSKDIADYAVEISTTTFFSRTYTIDHQQE
jgi:hypothetical protein